LAQEDENITAWYIYYRCVRTPYGKEEKILLKGESGYPTISAAADDCLLSFKLMINDTVADMLVML
jgi:hypothetical protein